LKCSVDVFRLNFYGFELANEKTGELRRSSKDPRQERLRNLNTSPHNHLRITVSAQRTTYY